MITHKISNSSNAADQSSPAEATTPATAGQDAAAPVNTSGNGSVAHQIIGKFLTELDESGDEATLKISADLRNVVFSGKPTEIELKIAMFGV